MDQVGNLSPKFIKAREENKIENFMTDAIMTSEIIKIGRDQIVETEEISIDKTCGKPRYEQNYRRGHFRSNASAYQTFGRQNSREEYRNNYRMKSTVEIEVGVGLEKDHFKEMLIIEGMIEV